MAPDECRKARELIKEKVDQLLADQVLCRIIFAPWKK